MNRSTSTQRQGTTHTPAGQLPRCRAARRGISLLEVMLATVLLLTAVMALSRVAFLARRHAAAAEDRTQAQLLCQNIMQEILAGVRPRASVSPEAFEGDAWVFMVDVEAVEGAPLSQITVQVDRLKDETSRLPTEDEMEGFRLVQWLRAAKSPSGTSDEGRGGETKTGEPLPGN